MQPHLFVLFNQSVGCWSAFKAPKGEVPADKPGPRSDPKSQLLVTLIFANNPAASRIFLQNNPASRISLQTTRRRAEYLHF
jgi:hypothetical protein